MSVQESLKIGAYDIQKYANRSLGIAFLLALLVQVFLVGGPTAVTIFSKNGVEQDTLKFSGPVTLEEFAEEDDLEAQENEVPPEELLPPPPPPMAADMPQGTGSEGASGEFIATKEEVTGPSVADMSEVNFARKGGGDGNFNAKDFDDLGNMDDVLKKREEKIEKVIETPKDRFPEFIPDATPPKYSDGELLSNLKYPTLAEEQGLEGTVYVKVAIDKLGKVQKVTIQRSANSLFNEAATEAVRKTTFSPAIQNGYPVEMSITIPVRFKLEG
ncbi:MAG: energy transducer TonB [Ignavibacteriae bacterium]|nr:energy transducer TonB [Ignavibacteriota bacterium]MCB9214761.1 energy transducer TonB [Ignavibacteria bacterium]